MRITLIAAATLALAACQEAPPPMASAEQDVAGKQLAPPPSGMGALYITRRPSGNVLSIFVGPNMAGTLSSRTWLRLDLPPGTYDIRCMTPLAFGGAVGSALVSLSVGETKFVYASESLATLSCPLALQTEAAARPQILAGNRVREMR